MHTFYPLTALLACAAAAPQPMSRRQFTIPPTPDTSSYAPIGDGSPRQAYLYEQVTVCQNKAVTMKGRVSSWC
jgi:hypothetical protein